MLQENKQIDRIEIYNNIIHVREKISITKDGVEVASSFNRYAVSEQTDLQNADPFIVKIANVLWENKKNTDEIQNEQVTTESAQPTLSSEPVTQDENLTTAVSSSQPQT